MPECSNGEESFPIAEVKIRDASSVTACKESLLLNFKWTNLIFDLKGLFYTVLGFHITDGNILSASQW